MLSCKEVSLLLSKSCDQKLSRWERLAVRLHLLYCRGCARLKQQLKFLRAAGQRLAQQAAMPDGPMLSHPARSRIREALRRS
jgi:hypothetical protein